LKPKIVSLNDNGCLTATYLQTQSITGLQTQSITRNVVILRDLVGKQSIMLNRDNAEVLFAFLCETWPGIGDLDK